jgi:hypothetical protein
MPIITEYLSQTIAWWMLLFSIFLNGLANSFVQGSLFGYSSIFPKKYTAVMMTSQAISAIILNVAKIMCLAILPESNVKARNAMYIYISIGTVILIGCIFGYNFGKNFEFMRYYVENAKDNQAHPCLSQAQTENDCDISVSVLDKSGEDF